VNASKEPGGEIVTDPIARLRDALARAQQSEPDVPEAVVLATVDERGHPSARVVLLRGCDAAGLVFYTNYQSRKGRELGHNPHAALCFHWKSLGEQVRVEGRVERVSAAESDAYLAKAGAPASCSPDPTAHLR
jgi:pyridoxamine 5'-phosphate oxidase